MTSITEKYKHFWLLIALLCCVSFTMVLQNNVPTARLKNKKQIFVAGNEIQLQFEIEGSKNTQLYIHSSFGTTVLTSENGNFALPRYITTTTGKIDYVLLAKETVLTKGKLWIRPNTSSPVVLETYVGPPSIIAGGEDYTMQVVVATDVYDNPMPEDTKVISKHQFLSTEHEEDLLTKDLMAWKNIFSYPESGRILISSEVKETSSKEFAIDVFPSLAQDFGIRVDRRHEYADGNQITKFITSNLKDAYGNVVSDGTIVQFVVKDTTGKILQTQGNTINGQAVGKMLHPDYPTVWNVEAFIPGIAKSDSLEVTYNPIIENFETQLNQDNREIIIGPLLSFMNQLIPDGALVTLTVFKEGEFLEKKVKTSSKGSVRFLLREEFYPSGKYTVEISALGIKKRIKDLQLQ